MTVLAHKDGTKEQLLACHSYNVAENAREHAKDIDQGHVLFYWACIMTWEKLIQNFNAN